ncbi:MAG: hypothetical protein ABJV68_03970, partial [Paracoccaceae bacterium]
AREAGKPGCQARRRGEAAWPNARRTEGPFSPATREAELGRPTGKTAGRWSRAQNRHTLPPNSANCLVC